MYSHRLIERAQATALFQTRRERRQPKWCRHVQIKRARINVSELGIRRLEPQGPAGIMTAAAPKGPMSHHRNAAACHFYIKRDTAAGPEVPHAEDILWDQTENLHGNRKPSPPQAFVSSPPHWLMPETLRRVAASLRDIQLSQLCLDASMSAKKKKTNKKTPKGQGKFH